MKKIIVLFFVIASVPAFASDSLSAKVIQKFKVDFPQAENVRWFDNDNNTEVYYTLSDINCHIWFNAKGELVKTLRYYSEKDLSPYIKNLIQKEFPGKTIFGVTELSKASGLTYHITLEDEKSWTMVTSDAAGEMAATGETIK